MKKVSLLFISLLVYAVSFCQTDKKDTTKMENQIRKYYFVMLVRGANRTQDSTTAAKLQAGHLENINRLYKEGKIKVAGPFGDNGNWRGIFIFDCATEEEVRKLLDTDPMIAAGRPAYELHPWYTAPTGSFKPGKPE